MLMHNLMMNISHLLIVTNSAVNIVVYFLKVNFGKTFYPYIVLKTKEGLHPCTYFVRLIDVDRARQERT